jgi:ABC-type sugar transport system permease subunit
LRLVREDGLHHRAHAAHHHRQSLVLSFIGKMMVFDLIWVMTGGGPLWSTETVSTYVYKRAFEWNTFDLGYPSAIAVLWFIIILAFVAIMTRVLRQRDRLEF